MAEENTNSEEQAAASDDSETVQKKPSGGEGGGGGGGMNPKLVMIVLILNTVVVLVLAAVVWMSYTKSSNQVTLGDIAADKNPKPEEARGKEGEKGKEGKEGKEGDGSENFIKEAFTVNLADENGPHFAQVTVEIEVDDAFAREEIKKLKPKIRDFIVVVLSSKNYEQVESVDGRDFLREEIRNKINGYLTRGQIKNVYFTQFIVQ